MPVMSILTSIEQDVYTQPPVFSHGERKRFCDFPTSLLTIADTLRSPTNRVGFLLSCAYFRATKRFFPVQSFHQHDIEFIAQRWGVSPQPIDLRRDDKQTRVRHGSVVCWQHIHLLGEYDFQKNDSKIRSASSPRNFSPHLDIKTGGLKQTFQQVRRNPRQLIVPLLG